jgi:hypothetical protein
MMNPHKRVRRPAVRRPAVCRPAVCRPAVCRLAVGLLLASGLAAQEFIDTFDQDSPNPPPGWTAQVGVWSVAGGRLVTDQDAKWAYITKDGRKPTDFVIDFEAFYNPVGVQFAGVTGRYTSPTINLTAKIQESDVQNQDFERSFIYENPNAAGAAWTWKYLSPPVTTSCLVRFIVHGTQVTMQHDFDKDGFFDQSITRTTKVAGAGLIGACIWGASAIDDFELHNAVLQPGSASTPRVGTTFVMDLVTTARRIVPWRMAISLGNTGFPIGSRRIPLAIDPVLNLSLQVSGALGLTGHTDATGLARPALQIPNVASLVGIKVFTAAITLDGSRPDGIDNISNEIGIEFVK